MQKLEQKRIERAQIQDRYIAGDISAEECLRLLAEVDARYRARPTRRDSQNHAKLLALYAPIDREVV